MALNPRVMLLPHFPGLIKDGAADGPLLRAVAEAGSLYRQEGVEAVVVGAAGWYEEGPFQVDSGGRHKTLLDMDGVDVSLRYTCDGWVELATALHENGNASGVPVETVHRGMDHSASVPMSLMFPDKDRRVVPLATAKRSREQIRRWGTVVRETCLKAGAECMIVAGGSLTYDPAAHARGEDREAAQRLDEQILRLLEAGDWDGLAALPPERLKGGPAHVGLRHLWFLEGVLGASVPGKVLAYERVAGVGSAAVEFSLPGKLHAA